ncbi:ACP S-malonyltransferase [Advenella mimigardefordensis]|uniref:Malonyl CoA-acyl carrier protein transacylase n=1 Tax=Advenella mimigardefordensis (strain DSM 17166 / LMG 22922 / DPN7) TaxID=1247726 RepID=W0PCJ4_ADVMD|nr:ACP S-malonyltransferase [Advenella mimigardefordensis]AHG64466.1 malonyl CoA-acyl carrier protein transacylase [Advenella mimigardefordensis DPN7]
MKLAFVFPGQGSQTVGMLAGWAGNPAIDAAMQRASTALDQDLVALVEKGPAEELNLTVNTQPVMLACSVAMYDAWCQAGGPKPEIMAGHSLGEYSALTAAGTFSLEDAVRLVRIRASAMQDAVPVGTGGMAAILGLDDETVLAVCSEASSDTVVEAVNFNAPAQVVIAGHKDAVQRACDLAKAKGAKRALLLPVSAPFHSRLLEPAAAVLQQALGELRLNMPAAEVINNVDVAVSASTQAIADALVRQAWHPVRWVETVRAMKARGVTHVVECGPGKVLAGLIKRIEPELVTVSVYDQASLDAALAQINA